MAVAKAKAGVPNARDYIGNADGASPAPRAGMNEWIKQAIAASNGALWNNGSWGQRDMRGKPGSLSVHATGRAVDLSYRKSEKNPKAGRKEALSLLTNWLLTQTILVCNAFLTISRKSTGARGVAIVKHGSNMTSQQFTVHQVAIGFILR